jgi:hypothetical protein
MDGWRSNGAARLMNADADLAAQSLDFVLQMQLATLDFQYFQIVDREMLLSLGQLGFQRFVPQFKFHKMRLDRHQEGLLVSEWPDLPRSPGWEDTGQPSDASTFALHQLLCHATSRKSTSHRLCSAANRWILVSAGRINQIGIGRLP